MSHSPRYIGPMMRVILAILLGNLFLAGTVLNASDGQDTAASHGYRYRLTRVENFIGVANFWVADLDGDGADDVFRLYDGYRIYQANRFVRKRVLGPALYQGNSLYHICEAAPIDVDSTPGTEIALIKRDSSGDSLWIEVYKGAEKVLLSATKAIVGEDRSRMIDHWDGGAGHCYAEDLDNDGSKELILPLTVAYDLYPRGIYVYDYPSGDLKWWYPLAGNPMPLIFGDANKDGFKEIYVKTFACFNGAVVGDLVDTLSYIHVVDHLGNLLWRQTLGDGFDLQTREPHICDCDNDGTVEIYYTLILNSEEFDQRVWTLQKRRAVDNFFIDQLQFGADQEYQSISSAAFDSTGIRRLILDKNVCMIDPVDLGVITCGDIEGAKILNIEDLYDDDPRPEILISASDSIYIADHNLTIRGAYGRDSDGHYSKLEYVETQFGDHYVLATAVVPMERSSSSLEIYTVELVPDVPPGGERLPLWLLVIGIAIGTFTGGLISYVIFRNRRPKATRRYLPTAHLNNLLTSLSNFSHGHMAGKNLNRLMFLFSNLPEDSTKLEEIKPNLATAIEAFDSFTLAQLQRVIDSAAALPPMKKTAATLTKQSRLLSQQIQNISVAELDVNRAAEFRATIPKTILPMKEAIGQTRHYLQSHFSANLLRAIPEVLSAVAGQFQQQGVGFSEIRSKGGVGTLLFFDESELAAIFEELFCNACEAMKNSEKKELMLDIRFSNGEVNIKLSDSGCGLRISDPEQVFSRDYSTAGKGRGYGLYHARQQIERFGGHIRIYNNDGLPGATVELVLKTVKELNVKTVNHG